MAIVNLEKIEKYIINWIKDYAENAGTKAFVLGLSGGIDSALVALLCKKAGLPTICVNLPCHSSEFSYLRAANFAEEQGLDFMKLDISAAHDVIYEQVKAFNMPVRYAEHTDLTNPIAVGGLRSCLRAPVLSFFALATKGLIMGTGNRSEDNLTRYFQKFGDGCVDICPIADLFKSEVYELFAHMAGLATAGQVVGPKAAAAIYNATPTADLWGPDAGHEDESELGISYPEIEWADRQNMRNNIVTDDEDPVRKTAWQGYTSRQREVVAKMHAIEKATRHKYNPNLPVCEVRKVEGLVQ